MNKSDIQRLAVLRAQVTELEAKENAALDNVLFALKKAFPLGQYQRHSAAELAVHAKLMRDALAPFDDGEREPLCTTPQPDPAQVAAAYGVPAPTSDPMAFNGTQFRNVWRPGVVWQSRMIDGPPDDWCSPGTGTPSFAAGWEYRLVVPAQVGGA